MKNTAPEVDDYIRNAAEFARPILKRLRKLFHQASPQIREEMKWSFPHFVREGIIGSMAAFKQHAGWGFWNAKQMNDPRGLLKEGEGLTALGLKIKDVSELPADDIILEYIREAVRLDEVGVKRQAAKKKPMTKLDIPKELTAALKQNPRAKATFDAFSPSHKREYVDWINEAKQAETRLRRLATTLEWLNEGKPRHWKYLACGTKKKSQIKNLKSKISHVAD